MTADRSGENNRRSLPKGCVYFIIIFAVYLLLARLNLIIIHSGVFFSTISIGFLVAVLVLVIRAIRLSPQVGPL